jgi:hypothetical protein
VLASDSLPQPVTSMQCIFLRTYQAQLPTRDRSLPEHRCDYSGNCSSSRRWNTPSFSTTTNHCGSPLGLVHCTLQVGTVSREMYGAEESGTNPVATTSSVSSTPSVYLDLDRCGRRAGPLVADQHRGRVYPCSCRYGGTTSSYCVLGVLCTGIRPA